MGATASDCCNTQQVKGLEFVFKTPEGKKLLSIPRKPVGLFFEEDEMPIVVSNVKKGTQADMLGVKVGWQILSVGKANLTTCQTYDEAVELILQQLATLEEPKVIDQQPVASAREEKAAAASELPDAVAGA